MRSNKSELSGKVAMFLLLFYILDLEFETEPNIPAPEPALYETAYVTSHKGNCRAGCFSNDGQLIATGSVDASIKVISHFRKVTA